jgi:mannose/fructose/N-acetylgalactosamine-specific phosphotransferase system component IIB
VKLVLTRIDDRLLHAQVALGWVGALSPDVVLVADDLMAVEQDYVPLLRMGLPPEVELVVAGVDESVRILKESSSDKKKCILLVRTPAEALRIVEAGISVSEINVGGMHFAEGKRRLLHYVYVDDADVRTLRKLSSTGMSLTAQDVPGNPSYDLRKLLETKP